MSTVNKIYTILTDGKGRGRKLSTDNRISTYQQKLRDALMPTEDADGLAELYIRLCYTDKELKQLLYKADPINTYAIVDLTPTLELSNSDLSIINRHILGIGLLDVENSASVWDNIRVCLKALLESL